MRVFCPKCNAGYEIKEELLFTKARRLKCGNCGEVFTVDKIDKPEEDAATAFDHLKEAMADNNASDSTPKDDSAAQTSSDDTSGDDEKTEDEVAIDIEDIFERLSERTENLINEEKKLPFYKKFWLSARNIFGLHFRINWKYVIVILIIAALVWMYNKRYDIVRTFPFMNTIYKTVGIKAKIVGEGLEFQNISWDLQAEDEGKRLDIRGFIFNKTDKNIEVPMVHIEILDKETRLLQSINSELKDKTVRADERIPLLLSVKNPAPILKYVYITFIDID